MVFYCINRKVTNHCHLVLKDLRITEPCLPTQCLAGVGKARVLFCFVKSFPLYVLITDISKTITIVIKFCPCCSCTHDDTYILLLLLDSLSFQWQVSISDYTVLNRTTNILLSFKKFSNCWSLSAKQCHILISVFPWKAYHQDFLSHYCNI